jgi:Growth-Arrest-Specific Protein 2 Domain
MDDILADLSPLTTLEAFTSASGKLRASIEAASPTQRAFGIRAAIASKKIQEWVTELSGWLWPTRGSSEGFLLPVAKRRKTSDANPLRHSGKDEADAHDRATETVEFWGSLPAEDVIRYESRIDDIWEDMEDLDVEEIKRQILETHVLPRSRPSTPRDFSRNSPRAPPPLSYTRIDDFTAVVTATVLQALPNLSRLNALMNVWSTRLTVLRQIPPLLLALDETEVALRSGWKAINTTETTGTETDYKTTPRMVKATVTRNEFEIMRNTLRDMVTILGQRLDRMLDALEGQEDTIPESWLDRMEVIEQEYGEWAVCGDRKVREGEWAREAAQRWHEKKLPKTSPEPSQITLREPMKFEPEEKQPTAIDSEEDRALDQHLHKEIHTDTKKTTPSSSPPIIYLSSAEISNEGSPVSTKISSGIYYPQLQEQENAGQTKGYISPTEQGTSSELENKGVEQSPVSVEDSDSANGKPILDHPHVEDIRKNDDDAEYPASTDNDPEADSSHKGSIEAGTVESPIAAAPGGEEVNGVATHAVQPLSDMDLVQLTHPPQSLIPRFSPIDGSHDVDGIPELQETSQQSQDNLITPKSINSASNISPVNNEESDVSLPIRENQHILLPSSEVEPDVSEEGGISNLPRSKDGIEEITISLESLHSPTPSHVENGAQSTGPEHATQGKNAGETEPTTPLASQFNFATPEASDDDEENLTPRTPSPSSESSVTHAIKSPSNQPRNGYYVDGGTPRSPSKAQRLTLDFANTLNQSRPSNSSSQSSDSRTSIPSQKPDNVKSARNSSLLNALPISEEGVSRQEAKAHTPNTTILNSQPPFLAGGTEQVLQSNQSIAGPRIESPVSIMSNVALQAGLPPTNLHSGEDNLKDSGINADTHMEKALVYFVGSEHAGIPNNPEPSESGTTPLLTNNDDGKLDIPYDAKLAQLPFPLPVNSAPETTLIQDTSIAQSFSPTGNLKLDDIASLENASIDSPRGTEILGSVEETDTNVDYKTEIAAPGSHDNLGPAATSRKESISSDASTSTNRRRARSIETPRASSPIGAEVPASPITVEESASSENIDEESPFLARIRVYNDLGSYSPPSSPPSMPAIPKRRQLQPISSTPFDPNALSLDSPMTPREPPLLSNVEVSQTPVSSPSKVSTDQFQQQISEILGSIPARIRLTSEPDSDQRSDTIQLKKRPSLTTGFRPMSRSSTPSFTLAPAYAKNPRPRAQNGNPEIKLYHLSRGTGEPPIKLFVRLVGEHGERVMVRVGGGWADLGEYLKEYASHHGRKSDKTGKVEIQNLPSRVVSVGSAHSASNLKNGNGRSSPVSRPSSSLDRPLSSLAIRKTRKSVGEDTLGRQQRSPSTPQPYALRNTPPVPRQSETPPSATSRPVSRLSWSEEESPLGLAGPTSKKVDISAENAAWVESMKEKVRLASAEKKEKTTATTDFGQLGKVGGTKRLFKKGAT